MQSLINFFQSIAYIRFLGIPLVFYLGVSALIIFIVIGFLQFQRDKVKKWEVRGEPIGIRKILKWHRWGGVIASVLALIHGVLLIGAVYFPQWFPQEVAVEEGAVMGLENASEEALYVLVEANCEGCHGLDQVYGAEYDEGQWLSVIERMVEEHEAAVNDKEKAALARFLATNPGQP